jgi:FSR family fosmidomycin resistance protein-like MFS transporter
VLAHFGHHLLAALLTPLLPFIRDEFVLDYTQVGWMVSAFTVSYGIGQLPAGWLADRIGSRAVITIGISGVALSGLLVGLSPTYIMLVIFLVLLGVTGGGYHPASAPLVSAAVEPKTRGRALGIHQIGGTASFFLAPLIAGGIATALGWRGSFIVISIPVILFGVVFYLLLGRRGYTKKGKPEIPSDHPEKPPLAGDVRRLVAFLILSIFSLALVISIVSFIPLFLVDHFRVSEEVAAALLALVYSSGIWAGVLGGYLSDRWGRVPVLVTTCLFASPVIYLLYLASFGWAIFVLLIGIGMAVHIPMPVSEAYLVSHTSERNRSTILGIYFFGSRGGPGVITPVIGYLIDHFGFYTSFSIAAIALVVVTFGCAIFLRGSQG